MSADKKQYVTLEEHQGFGKQLVDVLGQVGTALKEIRDHQVKATATPRPASPAAPAPAPAAPAQDDVQAILDGLARGDTSPLTAFVQKAVKASAASDPRVDQLASLATTEAAEKIQLNQSHFRSEIDKKYGDGAYEKYFASRVADHFKDQPALQANRTFFNNVVNLVRGEQFDELATHQADQAKAAAERAAAEEKEQAQMRPFPFMLGGGMPATRDGKLQFDDQDRAFMAKFEDRMGEKIDPERAGKILQATTAATREANTPFVSVSLDQLRSALTPPAAGN